jgi:hypothetical protein
LHNPFSKAAWILSALSRPLGGGALQSALDRADRNALLSGDLQPALAAGDARENFPSPKPPRLPPLARGFPLPFALAAGGGLNSWSLRILKNRIIIAWFLQFGNIVMIFAIRSFGAKANSATQARRPKLITFGHLSQP